MRRDFDIAELSGNAAYHLLTATVVPRPIAWVSSTSADGVDNLAPHSFYTVSAARPPVVQFSSVGRKDTLRNVQETGEFVICLTPASLWEQVNATSIDAPAGVSEFDHVGIRREPSARVRPPRVADSPVAIECTLNRVIELGDSTVVMGDVIWVAVDEAALDTSRPDRPHPRIEALEPLSRLGKDEWGVLGEIRSSPRPRWTS